jgi:hypothetical protein
MKGIGKPGKMQRLTFPGQKNTITPGDTLSRSMGQYGKGHSLLGAQPAANAAPVSHAGMNEIRGGSGGIKKRPRQGGIGPGPMGNYGSDTLYPKEPTGDQTQSDVIV